MKYPAYPDYRPIPNSVLARLPVHWQMKRLKFIAEVCNGRDQKEVLDDNGPYLVYGSGGPFGCATDYLYDGVSVLLGRKGTIDKPLLVREPFWTVDTMFYTRIAEGVDPRYFYYLCTTIPFDLHRDQTTLPSMTQTGLADIPFPVAPEEEQAQIADFLDWRTAQIDALIAKKQALIQRLDEAFYARMAFVLTGKRSVSGSLRPSGVAWLGDVPAHWQVMKLSRVVEARCDGPFGSGLKSEHYVDQGVRVIRLQNIGNAEFLNGDAAFIDPEHYRELGDHDVLPGDLLIAGLGDNNTPVGRACVAPEGLGPAMVKADCFRYRLDTQMAHAPFIAYQLSISAWLLRGALASGVTRARMNLSATSDRVLAFPPIDEQKAIAIELDSERQRADSVKRKVHAAIERLTEYRSALITAAVTGQIDVRGVKVPAPV